MKYFALRLCLCFTMLVFAGGCGSDTSEEEAPPSGNSESSDPKPGSPKEKFEPRGGRGIKPDDS